MKVHERGRNWHIYGETGIGFTMDIESFEDYGEIRNWEISIYPNYSKKGTDLIEIIQFLQQIIKEKDLKHHTKFTKDLIIIYTDNLDKIKGFFHKYITDLFENLYIEVLDFFEFRDINRWKNLNNSKEIANYAQYLIDNYFIPDKYFYITPNQIPRRRLKKSCKLSGDLTAMEIFPISFDQYKTFRKALFGGICYVPYKNLVITDPIMCLDLKSAYIYDLLIEKHCKTCFRLTDEANYEFYLESNAKTSIGNYTIKYKANTCKIHCFKDIDGNNFEKGEFIVNTTLTNIDLKILIELCDEIEIKCNWLYDCELDYLPKYMRDVIVEEFVKKEKLKNLDKEKYDRQKQIVNGIFGDCIRKYDESLYNDMYAHTYLAPQWGIWCTSYARKNLLDLALKVKGWVYSDTDSIYCFDTPENRELVTKFNTKIRKNIENFCKLFDYDYEILKNLGTFEIEKEIVKFRAITQKVYMYETKDGEFKLVAAGLNQDTIDVNAEMFEKEKIDWGSRIFKYVTENSYYERVSSGDEMKILTICALSDLDEQY